MIYSPTNKVIIITPPKTGSTSLHFSLCQAWNWVHIVGPQVDGHIEKHTLRVPLFVKQQEADHTCLMIVRSPYARLWSLYQHWLNHWSNAAGTLEIFIRKIMIPQCHDFLGRPLSWYYHQAEVKPMEFIPMEELSLLTSYSAPIDNIP